MQIITIEHGKKTVFIFSVLSGEQASSSPLPGECTKLGTGPNPERTPSGAINPGQQPTYREREKLKLTVKRELVSTRS